ncbi:MAG: BrnT family toxin [Verrucomicrobia bacterium]|nr:BrnT family toxin [Verrucomicrobiota bacterium]
MEFDWNNPPFECESSLTPRDIEESFEDPFAVKLMPDSSRFGVQARFFNLGKSASGLGVISIYRTNGKLIRVIQARAFTPEEQFFYQRKLNQVLAQ